MKRNVNSDDSRSDEGGEDDEDVFNETFSISERSDATFKPIEEQKIQFDDEPKRFKIHRSCII